MAKTTPRIVNPIFDVKKLFPIRIRKRQLPGLSFYCLATPITKKDGVRRPDVTSQRIGRRDSSRRAGIDAAISANRTVRTGKTTPLQEGFVFTGRRKMELGAVEKEVHGNGVFQRNAAGGLGYGDFDGLALNRQIQILNDLKDVVANLLF
jgi:hypothetical protein